VISLELVALGGVAPADTASLDRVSLFVSAPEPANGIRIATGLLVLLGTRRARRRLRNTGAS